ncbi:MAG: adventurous gliding motility lipoprotein CglD [Myxococcota bacterium]
MASPRLRSTVVLSLLLSASCSSNVPTGSDDGGVEIDGANGSDAMISTDAAVAGDAAAPDSGVERPDPNRSDNDRRDTDCDGLTDAEEFGTIYASGQRSDPGNPDTDGDGLPDGLELGRTTSVDPRCTHLRPDGDRRSHTDPTTADSDGDGLADGDEDANQDGVFQRVTETDPRNPDSDGDGLCDGPRSVPGVCMGGDPQPIPGGVDSDHDGVVDALDQHPNNPDADGDGLCDGPATVPGVCVGGEDLDGDGARGPGETDPELVDTDCDGLVDGASYGSFIGERTVGSDPTNADTDGDGLRDGVEVGIRAAPDPRCLGFVPDADPSTTTDPTKADTDRDTIPDGAEDSNQNGRLDPGELDPRDPADGARDPTTIGACGLGNLVPIDRRLEFQPDLQVATRDRAPDAYLEATTLLHAGPVGLMGYNATVAVAYLSVRRASAGADAIAEEQAIRAILDGVGALSTPITTATRTWDGYPVVYATYDMAGRAGLKERANAIASALIPGATALLTTSGDVASNGFHLAAQVVRRSASSVVVLVALAPAARAEESTAFALSDIAGGSALAQFGDSVGVQCDRFVTEGSSDLDILWAVDNSVSMSDEQNAVAEAALGMAQRLSNAPISWRTAVVASGFYRPGTGAGCTNTVCRDATVSQCRPFTTDLGRFARWFTENDAAWIGAGGPCNQPDERIIYGSQLMLSNPPQAGLPTFMPPAAAADDMHLRAGAHLLVILMGDADDQNYPNSALPMGIDAYEAFFRGLPVASIQMGGILCPEGETCGETQRTPRVARELVNRFGGVIGSLNNLASIAPTVAAIIDTAVGSISPYRLTKDAIASTIKVVVETGSTVGPCNTGDVPRSRRNGFDYDPSSHHVQFFGNCRPARSGSKVSVSYRYYIDQTGQPDHPQCSVCNTCTGISRCDLASCQCVCDQAIDCGPGQRWDPALCDCVCDAASLGCDATHRADKALCACVCAPDCGGCAADATCNASLCQCSGGV